MEVFPGLVVSEDAIEKYHIGMEDVWGQGLLSRQLWEATKAFLQSELASRRTMLAKELGLAQGMRADYYVASERYFNQGGLMHLVEARSSLERFVESDLFAQLTDFDISQYKDSLKRAEYIFRLGIVETGVSLDDGKLAESEYASQIQIAISEGYQSLIRKVIDNMGGLMEVRRTDARGREKASPRPLWKAILLAILLGTNVAAIIACFKTKQCTALGALAGSMPGWAAILVIVGC